jgi:glucose/arabinose dehydrogenase
MKFDGTRLWSPAATITRVDNALTGQRISSLRRARCRPERVLPASRWQNLPARCRQQLCGFALTWPLTTFALLATLCLGARAATSAPFELRDGDRVLFIGDTFFEREVDYGHIETRLTAAFPNRNVIFRNLAWAADTPMGRSRASFDWNKSEQDWLKRVKEQVALVKPTVAFLSYGMTAALESGAGVSPAEQTARIEKFKTDMNKLMDAIEEVSGSSPDRPQKVRFVLLGPNRPEGSFLAEAESRQQLLRNVELWAAGIEAIAGQRGARFVALHRTRVFTRSDRHGIDDGIHLNEHGYGFAVRDLKQGLGLGDVSLEGSLGVLNAAIRKKNELFFHRWRPANWTYLLGFRKGEQGQNAVELPRFDPLIAEWEARIAKLRDLKHQDPATVKEVRSLLDVRSSMFDVSGSRTNIEHSTSNAEHRIATLPTFEVADGFEVNLWAEDPQLHKPIEINWDAHGRLWVASSEVYPQIQPGQPATDSVVVLEDTDGNGKADKSSVFAHGLLIPTGVLPDSDGGCYVAASHQLLYFKDTNGDGKADEQRIVLSSFGTEDTHHNLHTLRWGYDGHIYMNQSIYTHTHVETPHGVVRLNSAGIWRFNPTTYRMEVFTKGGCNPWGHAWDDYGNSFFTDGAGFQGVSYCVPGAMYFTYAGARRELQSISPGNYPKFAGLEVVRSPQFPDDWQADFITCDFRAHRVVHFKYSEAGAGFQTKEMPDLLRSTNVTFRPIDVKFGPDGALYIADWSNPIIQHGEVDFRDPRRDKEHGRIWRVTAKGRPLAKPRDLTQFTISELLDRTLSKNGWEQEQARVVLSQHPEKVGKAPGPPLDRLLAEASDWLAKQSDPRAKLEVLWLHEAFGKSADALVNELSAAKDDRLRTAAARQLSR